MSTIITTNKYEVGDIVKVNFALDVEVMEVKEVEMIGAEFRYKLKNTSYGIVLSIYRYEHEILGYHIP